jgi:hypothetical protein
MSKALNCLVCCWLGQQVNLWQIEMGWPDIHWLAKDNIRVGWWQPCLRRVFELSLPMEPELAPAGGAAPTGAPCDGFNW